MQAVNHNPGKGLGESLRRFGNAHSVLASTGGGAIVFAVFQAVRLLLGLAELPRWADLLTAGASAA